MTPAPIQPRSPSGTGPLLRKGSPPLRAARATGSRRWQCRRGRAGRAARSPNLRHLAGSDANRFGNLNDGRALERWRPLPAADRRARRVDAVTVHAIFAERAVAAAGVAVGRRRAGSAGPPGCTAVTYATIASISLCGNCAPRWPTSIQGTAAGMRPVLTMKSTSAAPTPRSDGAFGPPRRSAP